MSSNIWNPGMLFDPKQWYPSPDREIIPANWFLPLTQVAFMGSTMLSRDTRIRLAAPVLLLLISQTRTVSTGDTRDFLRASHIFQLAVKFIDFGMLVKDGEEYKLKDRKRDDRSTSAQLEKNSEEKGIWQKVKDSVELWLFTYRGVGWNWKVGGIEERLPQTVQYFLFRTMLRILGTYLAWDMCRYTIGSYAYIQNPARTPFFEQAILDQVALTWLHQFEAFSFINLPYQILAFLAVAAGLQSPDDWPPLWGKISDAFLVSKAWGRTWHQLMRRQNGVLTPYVQKWLGATARGTRRNISLICSFTMSGFMHWSGVFNMPWTPTSHGMFTYFIMQAPAIRIEDWVMDWGHSKKIKSNVLLKILGYLWTFGWFSYSMRYAAAWQYESGALSAGKVRPFAYSIVRLVARRFLS